MVRYYPPSKIIPNLSTLGGEFVDSKEKPYVGKYYVTFEGKYFTGAYPEDGKNEPLKRPKVESYIETSHPRGSDSMDYDLASSFSKTRAEFVKTKGAPVSYQPRPSDSDYTRGYLIRYFTKKENEKGFIIEISEEEYNNIVNGTADYDISIYQTAKILWKLTGPLRNKRQSQYNMIPGIIDTNQRLTESTNKTFLGMVDFIGGDYAKFSRPTP